MQTITDEKTIIIVATIVITGVIAFAKVSSEIIFSTSTICDYPSHEACVTSYQMYIE
jgi:hypothetical protein